MKRRSVSGIIMMMMLMVSCNEYDLSKSIFIPDKENPDLPAYSEWGYNTFGAYYDREPFVNQNSVVPAKVITTGGTTSFMLIGILGSYSFHNYNPDRPGVTFTIELPGFSAQTRADLLELNDVVINLGDPLCNVHFAINGHEKQVEILSGSLHFKRVQNLIVDKEPTMIILSGTFLLQALIDGVPSSIADGRFDVGIGEDNFFNY
jgi:hypothetical protein